MFLRADREWEKLGLGAVPSIRLEAKEKQPKSRFHPSINPTGKRKEFPPFSQSVRFVHLQLIFVFEVGE